MICVEVFRLVVCYGGVMKNGLNIVYFVNLIGDLVWVNMLIELIDGCVFIVIELVRVVGVML